MQLTRFDRWLRKRFIYETHIYTLSPPAGVPRGVRSVPLPDQPGRRFNHLFVARDERLADSFIARLKADNQMFATRVVNRKTWLAPLIAPEGKSFTWKCIWIVTAGSGGLLVSRGVKALWDNPEVQRNLIDALEVLKG